MKKLISILAILGFMYSCSTARPIAATSNKIGSAKGVACAKTVLGFIPLETDASINTAARNGNLKEITTVDYEGFFALLYNSECTIVHGNK